MRRSLPANILLKKESALREWFYIYLNGTTVNSHKCDYFTILIRDQPRWGWFSKNESSTRRWFYISVNGTRVNSHFTIILQFNNRQSHWGCFSKNESSTREWFYISLHGTTVNNHRCDYYTIFTTDQVIICVTIVVFEHYNTRINPVEADERQMLVMAGGCVIHTAVTRNSRGREQKIGV